MALKLLVLDLDLQQGEPLPMSLPTVPLYPPLSLRDQRAMLPLRL